WADHQNRTRDAPTSATSVFFENFAEKTAIRRQMEPATSISRAFFKKNGRLRVPWRSTQPCRLQPSGLAVWCTDRDRVTRRKGVFQRVVEFMLFGVFLGGRRRRRSTLAGVR